MDHQDEEKNSNESSENESDDMIGAVKKAFEQSIWWVYERNAQ